MLSTALRSLLIMLFMLSEPGFAFEREIAITIDDLPFVGEANNNPAKLKREQDRFMNIMQALVDNNVPATGFVIAGDIEKGQWELLEQFRQAGFVLGNHTYTHINLNTTSAEKYIDNVDKADKVLEPLMSNPRYFRYPYLAEGNGQKRLKVKRYLNSHNYVIAPVTVDSKDFLFNKRLYHPFRLHEQTLRQIKPQYLAYIWKETLKAEQSGQKPILLIHANLLNSYCMADIIALYKKKGYRFISLEEALNQPVKRMKKTDEKKEELDQWLFPNE